MKIKKKILKNNGFIHRCYVSYPIQRCMKVDDKSMINGIKKKALLYKLEFIFCIVYSL